MKFQFLSVLFICFSNYSAAQLPYFHYGNDDQALTKVDSRKDQNIILTVPGDTDLSVYGLVRVKIFGTKSKNRLNQLYQIIDLPSSHVQNKIKGDLSYDFVFLKNIDRNIWVSDLGIHEVGVMSYNYIRVEIWGITSEGLAIDSYKSGGRLSEHLISSSKWLEVRAIKTRNTTVGTVLRGIIGVSFGLLITALLIVNAT